MKDKKTDPSTDVPVADPPTSGPVGGGAGGRVAIAAAVLQGVQRGDSEALGEFFEHYFNRIYGLAYRLLGERAAAEDATQDVFYKVQKAAHKLDPSRDPTPWLITITVNTCRSLWRSVSHRMSVRSIELDSEAPGSVQLADAGRDPEQQLMSAERELEVQTAINRLPEGLKTVVLLRDYEGMDHLEIADVLQISHDAVRKRYSRALAELGESLKGILE